LRNDISSFGGLAHLFMLRSGHFMSRPLTRDDLIRKALLVVEEACADGRVRQSMGLRFALAYLYATAKTKDRGAFDRLWRGRSLSIGRPDILPDKG
jgi:hypothetical protein